MINTVNKFLISTSFKRGTKHPTLQNLKIQMKKLKVSEELRIDLMTFFLFDNESFD